MKHSIFKQTAAVFGAVIIFSSAAAAIASFVYNSGLIENRASLCAREGSHMAAEIVESIGYDKLCESGESETYIKARREFKHVCESFDLDYLYLYEPIEGTDTIRFILVTSDDNEADMAVAAQRGFGTVIEHTLTEPEQSALSGMVTEEAYVEQNQFGAVYTWFYPVYGADGAVAIIGSDYRTDTLLIQTVKFTLIIIIPMVITLVIAFLIALFVMRKKILGPIKLLSDRMSGFIANRDFTPPDIHSEDEIGEMADSFVKMTEDIQNYIQSIKQLTLDRARASVELEVARRIQNGIVPESKTVSEYGYEIYAAAKPAREVGGDFYDCFKTRGDKICVVIGDVSGKGIAAAMFMIMARTLLRDRLGGRHSPAQALNSLNDALYKSNPEGMFVTVFAAVLDTKTGDMVYANAGHNAPVIWSEDGARLLGVPSGIALGVFEDSDITDSSRNLKNGEGLLLYTDGVTEAVSANGEFFGNARLLEALSGKSDSRAAVDALSASVREFTAGAEQFDDYTVLALHRGGGENHALRLSPEISELPKLRGAVLTAAGNTERGRKIYLACEEIFVNIANYSGASEAIVTVEKRGNTLTASFTDDGAAFDPVSAEMKEKEFEEHDNGGMGIKLVKSVASGMSYSRDGNKNVLTIKFDIP